MKLTSFTILVISVLMLMTVSKAQEFTILAKYLVGPDAPEDDGTVLKGDATWERFPMALNMRGSGTVTVPATTFEEDDFTVGVWVRPEADINKMMFVYANWKRFWSFFIALKPVARGYEVVVELRRNINSSGSNPEGNMVSFSGGFIPAQTWKHIAVTWNGATGVSRLLIDGKFAKAGLRLPHAGDEREIQSNESPVHEVGFKADTNSAFFVGQLRELIIAKGLIASD